MQILSPKHSVEPERPLELLYACHDKIRRFCALSGELAAHVAKQGSNAEAQQAATNVLRYFEQALPLHHEDEELDIFPALRTLGDAALNAALDTVEAQHVTLDTLWQMLCPWLRQIAAGVVPEHRPVVLERFVSEYLHHTAFEESEIFAALERLPVLELERIARLMRQRRGAAA